ncbi:MAG: hypothetical protein H8E39_08110 [Alphaproteobacteria bacterium]|nr:hypothetical protein [Alphaproteobacteria bacterium]
MTILETWEHRPAEEANLFNPAFVASLIFEFAEEFQKGKPEGVPLTYISIALAISLHRHSRLRLPSSTVTSLYEWVQQNEDILISFSERISGLLPYIREAISFSMRQETLRFGEGHFLQLGDKKAHFSAPFIRDTTTEVSDTISKSKFIARWFLKSGSESSILACWGVRP